MANRFNFRILANSDAYDDIKNTTGTDPMTFYLCKTGEGWLGNESLFGGDAEKFNIIASSGDHTSEIEHGKIYVIAADGVTVGTHPVGEPPVDTPTQYPQGIYSGVVTENAGTKTTTLTNITYSTIAQYIVDNAIHANVVDENYSGNETTIMTSSAIVKYVNDAINTQAILDINFFKKVEQVIVTQEDIDDVVNNTSDGPLKKTYPTVDIGATAHKDDVGLVFIFDDLTGENGFENDKTANNATTYAFVNLCNLINIYNVKSESKTLLVTSSTSADGHKVEFNIEVRKAGSILTGDTNDASLTDGYFNASYISKLADVRAENKNDASIATTIDKYSDNKFITEKQFVDLLSDILKDYVKYE